MANKGGYYPVSPQDQTAEVRDEIVLALERAGLSVERAHHEVGAPGQQEINYRFNTLTHSADDIQKFKYVVKNTAAELRDDGDFHAEARLRGQRLGNARATSRSGPRVSRSSMTRRATRTSPTLLAGTSAVFCSMLRALLAFTNPTVNSYRRLVKGYEAPVSLVYSQGNRSAAIRIPVTGSNPKAKRMRVPRSRRLRQPLLGLRGHADGRPGRHQEPHRAP